MLELLHSTCHICKHLNTQVLLLSMLAPRSYTKEDVIELHCHGGGVCIRRVLERCLQAGARLAKPGEFTLRAFLNGRLDLSQVNLSYGSTPVAKPVKFWHHDAKNGVCDLTNMV